MSGERRGSVDPNIVELFLVIVSDGEVTVSFAFACEVEVVLRWLYAV